MSTIVQSLLSNVGSLYDDVLDHVGCFGQSTVFNLSKPALVSKIKIYLKKTGSPTGTIKLSLLGDSGLVYADLDVTTLTTSYAETTFTFNTPVFLNLYILYTFTLTTENAVLDAANYVTVYGTYAAVFKAGRMPTATTWNSAMNDKMLFKLYGDYLPETASTENPAYYIEGSLAVNPITQITQPLNTIVNLTANHPTALNTPYRSAFYQTFTAPDKPINHITAAFFLGSAANSVIGHGPLKMKIYAVTGTAETNQAPTGTALYESETLTPVFIGAYGQPQFNFYNVQLTPNTNYALTLEAQSGFDSTHGVSVWLNMSSTYTGGNMGRYFNSTWGAIGGYDAPFLILGYPIFNDYLKRFETLTDGNIWSNKKMWKQGMFEYQSQFVKAATVAEAKL